MRTAITNGSNNGLATYKNVDVAAMIMSIDAILLSVIVAPCYVPFTVIGKKMQCSKIPWQDRF
jgi:hypothetical protein